MGKIWYLCHKINNIEWSGVLFYTPEGDVKDLSTLKLTVKDIYLMDIGNGVYTEYSFDPSIMDAYEDNPELMDCKIGHIHSHHNMNVFFSGTDQDELISNSSNYNYYLSLIVNNKMEMSAKLAIPGKSKFEVTIKDNGGNAYTLPKSEGDVVNVASVDVYPFCEEKTFMEQRVEKLLEDHEKKSTYSSPYKVYTGYGTSQSAIPGIYNRTPQAGIQSKINFEHGSEAYAAHSSLHTANGSDTLNSPYGKLSVLNAATYQIARNGIPWMSTDLFIRRLVSCNTEEVADPKYTLRQYMMQLEEKADKMEDAELDILEESINVNYDAIFESVYGNASNKIFQAAAMDLAYEWLDSQSDTFNNMSILTCAALDIAGDKRELPRKIEE